jgi:hypothetical protein
VDALGGNLPGLDEALDFGDVVALASLVPRALFDRADAGNRTAEPDWMAARLAAHHAVCAAASDAGPALPLAFGALFSTQMRPERRASRSRDMTHSSYQRRLTL